MSDKPSEFDLFLPNDIPPASPASTAVRKFKKRINPGMSRYDLKHNLATEDVIVQTRIAGRVREGGILVLDENTVRIEFGGPLNEEMDVVVIG